MFWASILARCIQILSTPLVNNSEGRISRFKHLYGLLLDPIVITRQELVHRDFAEHDILRVYTVELIESLRRPKSETGNGLTNDLVNSHTDVLKTCSTNGQANYHPESHTKRTERFLESVAILMLTSETTGKAKAVCLTHKQFFAALRGK